jgi:alanyl-tRNA synthetase
MTSAEIRQAFLDFFASKQHKIVPSAPIVLKNDPSLLFTNAGMNQFKDYFLGNQQAPFRRVADTQKCLRVSGKHNDLEEVGVDTYHHTMFEMLGNWSFGDYFKSEAVEWSWELLTKVYGIDPDRLYVTVFEGDEKEGLPASKIAQHEWGKIVPKERILLGSKKDNFWEMGETGPCGPCSEIHVDCRSDEEREKEPGKDLVNKDHPQVIEIWNNVFIQYNRKKDGTLEELPEKHVDTGMGLERLVRILQNKTSNYDTDLFSGTIGLTETITGIKYDGSDSKIAVAFRVLADHIRAIGFTIADGQLPSNTGAGYVIRRILRRAVRYYFTYLNYKQPLLTQLVPVLAKQFENVFPELYKQADFVCKVVGEEEEAFLRTLDKGLKRLDDIVSQTKAAAIPGKDVFELYDTYGFPVDLTRLIVSEKNLQINEAEFEQEMKLQKNRSRAASAIQSDDWVILGEQTENKFVGYTTSEIKTAISKYRKVSLKGKEQFQLVLESTPFYAESGGQVGDTGMIYLEGTDVKIDISNTKKENNLIVHFTDALPSDISGTVIASVDNSRRRDISKHHTATHLLHAALRKVLGTHVVQKGSLVNAQHLRFDFSHFTKVTSDELREIEKLVNEKIRQNVAVVIKEMSKEEALQLGAMALFGEKYGERVRVVIIDPEFSVELCGGIHAVSTGSLGFFKISSETAVAAGVRRIEAFSGLPAEHFVYDQADLLQQMRVLLRNPKELLKAVENLQEQNLAYKKRIDALEASMLKSMRDELVQKINQVNGVSFIGQLVHLPHADALKQLAYDLRGLLSMGLVVLCSEISGKPFVAIGISDDLTSAKNLDAGILIKEIAAPLIKGSGGGQKVLAIGGGQDANGLMQVIEAVKSVVS